MKKTLLSALLTLVLLRISTSDTVGALNFDLVSDFSTVQNPNGPWSYELNGVPISASLPAGPGFIGPGWGYIFNYDSSITVAQAAGGNDVQPGDVLMHAPSVPYGGPSTYLDVKWTSPKS